MPMEVAICVFSDFFKKICIIDCSNEFDITLSTLKNDDPKYVNWLTDHNLRDGEFYISVGRFVPENNFDIMIREFMKSSTKKDFAIITTENAKRFFNLI